MSEQLPLHPSIIALVSLGANIAANHSKYGCARSSGWTPTAKGNACC